MPVATVLLSRCLFDLLPHQPPICLLSALCPHSYNYQAGGLTKRKLFFKRGDRLFSFIHPFHQMGLYFHYMNTQRHAHLLLLMLLLFSAIQARYSAEARPLSKLLEVAKEGGGKMVTERAMIGSRPPRCERRCITCGHCEAVQVPAVPQDRSGLKHFSTRITSRGDDSSNYKPMSWKCKCGDTILNP